MMEIVGGGVVRTAAAGFCLRGFPGVEVVMSLLDSWRVLRGAETVRVCWVRWTVLLGDGEGGVR